MTLQIRQTTAKFSRFCFYLSTSVPDKVYEINDGDKDAAVTLEALVAKEDDAWWNQLPLANLDLSSNQLTQLSPKIENLCSLTTLTVSMNIYFV